ncbi:hypothetical protein HMPREF0381_0220, partial [Lachnoanaerobaculum saburreum DSM 3986]
ILLFYCEKFLFLTADIMHNNKNILLFLCYINIYYFNYSLLYKLKILI